MTSVVLSQPHIFSYPNRSELGQHAAERAAHTLRTVITAHGSARIMLAAAPSQLSTLTALVEQPDIDWSKVTSFHMDDYIGLPNDAPQGFGNWLDRVIFDNVFDARFHRIHTSGSGADEADRYSRLMGEEPFDLVLLGLGVNCHLAFNDPPAQFSGPLGAKVTKLDAMSRQQQVDEGHFVGIHEVPTHAITVTIPRLLNAHTIIASVPGRSKRQAVDDTLNRPVSGAYPGTALRTHPCVYLYLDQESDPR